MTCASIICTQHTHASSALPKAELFTALHDLLASYPTKPELRTYLLDHLHVLLQQTLPTDPIAARLSATRNLLPGLEGAALVDALKTANEQLSAAVSSACAYAGGRDAEGLANAYAGFVEEWVQKDDLDPALVRSFGSTYAVWVLIK